MRDRDLQLTHDAFAADHVRIEHVIAQAPEPAPHVDLDLRLLTRAGKIAMQDQRAGLNVKAAVWNENAHDTNLPAIVILFPGSNVALIVFST